MLRRAETYLRRADEAAAKAGSVADPFVRQSYRFIAGSPRELATFRRSLERESAVLYDRREAEKDRPG